jgi:hypothetical protein
LIVCQTIAYYWFPVAGERPQNARPLQIPLTICWTSIAEIVAEHVFNSDASRGLAWPLLLSIRLYSETRTFTVLKSPVPRFFAEQVGDVVVCAGESRW